MLDLKPTLLIGLRRTRVSGEIKVFLANNNVMATFKPQ